MIFHTLLVGVGKYHAGLLHHTNGSEILGIRCGEQTCEWGMCEGVRDECLGEFGGKALPL